MIRNNTKCKSCLGCNLLEDLLFNGKYDCEAYRQSETKLTFIDKICRENKFTSKHTK